METFQALLTRKLAEALAAAGLEAEAIVTPATDPRFGDYQINVALSLAKARGQKPRVVAQDIIGRLEIGDWCAEPKVDGPGFINLRLLPESVAAKTRELLDD